MRRPKPTIEEREDEPIFATIIPLDVLPDPDRRPETSALIGEWSDWMEATGKSERTIEMYIGNVHRLLSQRYTRGRHVLDITGTEVVMFLAGLGKHGSARKQARAALRSIFGYLHKRGWRTDDAAAILEGVHQPRKRTQPAPFTADELRRLLSAAMERDPRRGWALQACYGLGTRRTEFVMIRPEDIDWETKRVYLSVTKRDKPRYVDIGPLAEIALQNLLELGPDRRGRVNGTVLGILPATFTMWVNQAAEDAGFPKGRKRRAHTLRSTFATHLGHAGVPVEVIRDLMGHESIETTSIYLGVYDGDKARAVRALAIDETMRPGRWELDD